MVITKVLPAYEGKSYRALKSVTLTDGFVFTATTNSSFFITIEANQTTPISDQVQSYNKVTTEIVKIPGIKTDAQLNNLNDTQKQTTTTYWDGLRRVIQTIDQKGSPLGNDMVKPIAYDQYGRQSMQYLPYVSGNTNGNFSPNAIAEQSAFYNIGDKIAMDSKPYAQSMYDSSPLDILVEQGGVGADFQPGGGHAAKSVFRVNTAADQVIRWTVNGPDVNYNEQELSVIESTDQNGGKTLTFSDKNGKLILKKVYLDEDVTEAGSTQHADYLETYYVYDDLGNLVYQVSPKATSKIKNGASWNDTFIDEWIFKYSYDENAHLIEKKVPGSGSTYIVYDKLDRPVMTQDAKMRTTNKWTFIKYDLLQRPVLQGIYTYSELFSGSSLTPRAQLQKYFNELNYDLPGTYFHEQREAGTAHGYSNLAFPTSNTTVLTVNYYDDYDFNNDASPDYSYINPGLLGAATEAHMKIQGQLTGNKKLVLGSSTWITSVVFYDRYGRVIEKRSNNQLYNSGLEDNQSVVYEGFSAAPKLTKQVKVSSANTTVTVTNRYESDHRNRVKQIYQSNNGSAEQLIAQYAYNELGQLIDKSLHAKSGGGFLQSLDYRYTIQGWLNRINNSSLTAESDDNGTNDIFGMEFMYNTVVPGLSSATDVRFDGKLSAVKWKINDVHSNSSTAVYERSYKFDYDKIGRLKNASYSAFNGSTWSAESGGYDERDIKYDHNGNILALKRYSINNGSSSVALIDDLTYTYNSGTGNQLKQVEDASGNIQGFKESAHISDEYGYDENGNLVSDKNKGDGITAMTIGYNELNKTSRVDLPGGKYILYIYAATGERLRKETHDNTIVKTIDYIDGFVFENSTLAYFPMAEGRVRNAGGILKYEYYITDQQGNVRLSFEEGTDGQAQIIQENHFYPFGMAMKGAIIRTATPSAPNKSFYNGGSELQDDFGDDPNVYSTFFREYDPVLGRMNAVDPMADKYSELTPYNYAGNDPIMFNDPMGDDFNDLDEVQRTIDQLRGLENGGSSTGINDITRFDAFGAFTAAVDYLDKYNGWGTNGAVGSFESAYANWMSLTVTGGYNPVDANGNSIIINGTSGNFVGPSILVRGTKNATTNNEKVIRYVKRFEGIPIFTFNQLKEESAFTLPGIGIFVSPGSENDINLLRHEFGHILQANAGGKTLFYNHIVPMSLISATIDKYVPSYLHQRAITETTANTLSYNYFGKPNNWDEINFPLLAPPTESIYSKFMNQTINGFLNYRF